THAVAEDDVGEIAVPPFAASALQLHLDAAVAAVGEDQRLRRPGTGDRRGHIVADAMHRAANMEGRVFPGMDAGRNTGTADGEVIGAVAAGIGLGALRVFTGLVVVQPEVATPRRGDLAIGAGLGQAVAEMAADTAVVVG